MSSASTSGVSFANAFFDPSGLHRCQHVSTTSTRHQYIPNQSVDLDAIHIIQLLQRLLDLPLIRLDIHNEHQRIVLLNLLHRTFSVQRVDNHLAGIEARDMRDGFARVRGSALETQGLGSVEGGAGAHFADLLRIDLWKTQGRQMMGALTRFKVFVGGGLRRGGSLSLLRRLWRRAWCRIWAWSLLWEVVSMYTDHGETRTQVA